MSAGVALSQVFSLIIGCSGKISLALERKRAVPKSDIVNMVKRLREAVEILERLLNDTE